MRRLVLSCLLLAGCSSSHGTGPDAGRPLDGASCAGDPDLFCVDLCGSDVGHSPVCEDGVWRCPGGTRDAESCPPGCVGPPPGPGCECVGAAWSCDDGVCPDTVRPYEREHPDNRCTDEGATCRAGDGGCGTNLFCTCEGGRWDCLVASPDPACWCEIEPRLGSRCVEEGASCGTCCPGPGEWGPMTCEDGRWVDAPCPPIECEHECGSEVCGDGQYCRSECGPAGGQVSRCEELPAGCEGCDCLEVDDEREECERHGSRTYVFPQVCF